jgi:hypothetical protein
VGHACGRTTWVCREGLSRRRGLFSGRQSYDFLIY